MAAKGVHRRYRLHWSTCTAAAPTFNESRRRRSDLAWPVLLSPGHRRGGAAEWRAGAVARDASAARRRGLEQGRNAAKLRFVDRPRRDPTQAARRKAGTAAAVPAISAADQVYAAQRRDAQRRGDVRGRRSRDS